MILTTGKDCRTVLWDVNGTMIGSTTSGSAFFDVQFSPTDPGVFATSSYGGGDGQDGTVCPIHMQSKADPGSKTCMQEYSHTAGSPLVGTLAYPACKLGGMIFGCLKFSRRISCCIVAQSEVQWQLPEISSTRIMHGLESKRTISC